MENLFHFAFQSVEILPDHKGRVMVVYWSPTIRDYWSTEGLGVDEAERIAGQIKSRLALKSAPD